jgi:iron complex transport system substrate-binding protein
MPRPRIVSLIASATEIVCALGFQDCLVGRSHECDYPPEVQRLPICTKPRFAVEGSSREIDERVKDVLRDGLSVYLVDEPLLRELRPDVIVTQSHCEVCAVSAKDVAAAVCGWLGSQPRVASLSPNCLEDVWRDIRQVADALGAPERGARVVAELRERMSTLAARAEQQPTRPTVACLEWLDPLMAAGNWMPELVRLAGGHDPFGQAGQHSPWLAWERVREVDPDVILALPCGFDLAKTWAEAPVLQRLPGWESIQAVRSGRVVLADGNQFFNRPGPRLVESLEILLEVLHPTAVSPRHRGTGWESW